MKIFHFLFIALFIQSLNNNIQIKENPIFLTNSKYPFVISTTDNYYYVITKGKSLKINKESGNIEKTNDNILTSYIYIYIFDNSNNNYIYYSNEYYTITYKPTILFSKITVESKSKSMFHEEIKIIGSIPKSNDFIIYGYTTNNLLFSGKSREYRSVQPIFGINDNLSCKFIEGEYYICAMIISDNLYLNCFKYNIKILDSYLDSLTLGSIPPVLRYNDISTFGLYDTDKNEIKILCNKPKNQQNIYCNFFKTTKNPLSSDILGDNNIIFTSNIFNEKNCYFSLFNSEYLFCCAIIDCIKCYRISAKTYEKIKEFKILNNGMNSDLTIKNNNNYITFFYMNNKNSNFYVYEYYIYLPTCLSKNYEIFKNLNDIEFKEELDKLSNLFVIKTNKYFFEIENPLIELGYFTLNNETLNQKIKINNNDYILNFIITNNYNATNFTIFSKYNVFVEEEEAYKAECQVTINFKICYHSCKKCHSDISYSNDIQHNCIKCKDNYYPSPENPNNCYLIEEKKINWYFDLTKNEFGVCHEECYSCTGPNNFNCLSCHNGLYLENNICTSKCSNGYFPIKIEINSTYYFNCSECYKNCKTCLKQGYDEKMNCESCKDNQISYNDSCFDINNSSIKNFNVPLNNGFNVTNCYEKFGLYIKEDSNECIPLPKEEEGYYLSNNVTGLLSKCYDNCFSCNSGPIKDDSGNIKSMECIKCKDSNSSEKTMIKMDNNCFKIIDYNQNNITFNASEIWPIYNFSSFQ